MSNAPEVRGLFLKALRRPVIVAPSSAEPTVTFDGPLAAGCPCALTPRRRCARLSGIDRT